MSNAIPARILVLNAGSSTLKYALFVDWEKISSQTIPLGSVHTIEQALNSIIDNHCVHAPLAIGHRVVHGGTRMQSPMRITEETLRDLRATVNLAPLHQLPAIKTIESSMAKLPNAVHVACFDTAFHSTLPLEEYLLPIPRNLLQQGIRRYGFHGLSYESIVSQLPQISKRATNGYTVICHLGSGCSLCGLVHGVSRYTTMSFTPQDGLIMGTRPGRIDSGVLLHLLRNGYSVDQLELLLTKQSGLLGLSDISSDMQTLLNAAGTQVEAKQAVDIFCRCVAREISAAATAIGGLDAIVFTAGIGENCALIRESIIQKLSWMNVQIDSAANLQAVSSKECSKMHRASSAVEILCMSTDEQSVMERHVRRILETMLPTS